jgi:hypothetical protein
MLCSIVPKLKYGPDPTCVLSLVDAGGGDYIERVCVASRSEGKGGRSGERKRFDLFEASLGPNEQGNSETQDRDVLSSSQPVMTRQGNTMPFVTELAA